jgi:hypothetical protein
MKPSYALVAGIGAGWIVLLLALGEHIDLPIVLLAACSLIGAALIASEALRKPPERCAPARAFRR